ncbi:hypothetical protein DL96DRAFT_1562889 [Flagelloscypha sp. PMI_526]|nr:hypothetical protein DL96DRAFT_1562889 [Flagelloscypha sp. PMI_526]
MLFFHETPIPTTLALQDPPESAGTIDLPRFKVLEILHLEIGSPTALSASTFCGWDNNKSTRTPVGSSLSFSPRFNEAEESDRELAQAQVDFLKKVMPVFQEKGVLRIQTGWAVPYVFPQTHLDGLELLL